MIGDSIVKALVFDGKLDLREVAAPIPAHNEALVHVTLAGICMTDLEISKGYMNFTGILGHEFVGVVEKSTNPQLLGKRVVGEINLGCGSCDMCKSGLDRHCYNRSVLGISGKNGALSEYITLPEKNLILIPDNVNDHAAVFVEPLAAALEIFEQIHVQPDMDTLIIGDGRLGLLVCMVLKLTGSSMTVVGKHDSKLDLFAKHQAATVNLNDLEKLNKRYDLVVEASGSPSGWDTAVKLVKPRGVIALKSTYHGDFSFNPAPLVINEITVVGSRCGRFAPALRLLAAGLVDPLPLISDTYGLDEAVTAFDKAREHGTLKILVRP